MLSFSVFLSLAVSLSAGEATESRAPRWITGTPEIASIGELAFGPGGVLFMADPIGATIFAVKTESSEESELPAYLIESPDIKIGALLGTHAANIQLNDIVVHPASGDLYVSVTRNSEDGGQPALVRVDIYGNFEEVRLEDIEYVSQVLQDATDERRIQSITDLVYYEDRLWVAGLSNEEFSSNLRSLAFPFEDEEGPTAIEIYHGNHGNLETHAPIRTFLPYELEGQPHLVAAYTCTPLVTFPIDRLLPGKKVRGKTVAELGGGNRPLDMLAYEKDGERYILLANSRHGVMRIAAKELGPATAIETPVAGLRGVAFETVEELEGVLQMTPAGEGMAAVLIQEPALGILMLGMVELP